MATKPPNFMYIFFHDTPHKSLNVINRFSHLCLFIITFNKLVNLAEYDARTSRGLLHIILVNSFNKSDDKWTLMKYPLCTIRHSYCVISLNSWHYYYQFFLQCLCSSSQLRFVEYFLMSKLSWFTPRLSCCLNAQKLYYILD